MAQESTDSFACTITGPAEPASSGTAAVMGLPPGTRLGEFEVIDKIKIVKTSRRPKNGEHDPVQ